jgi:hypothetical protein
MNTDIEELLHEGMSRFTERVPAPAGLAGKAGASHRRRRAGLRAAIAVPAAAVTAVAVTLAAGGTTAPRAPAKAGDVAGVPRVQTDAYVTQHIEKALGGASGKILFVTTHGKLAEFGGQSPLIDYWYYRNVTKGVRRLRGWSTADVETDYAGRSVDLFVNYSARVWWRHTWATAPLSNAKNVCAGPADDEPNPGSSAWAPFVRASLACGGLAVAGHARIGGRDTIKIIGTSRDVDARFVPQTMFVDPATYLPVRILIPSGWRDLRWLAPTQANVAALQLAVPHGFRHVPPPR